MSRNLILFEQRSKCQDLSPTTLKKGIRESVSSQESSVARGRGGTSAQGESHRGDSLHLELREVISRLQAQQWERKKNF